MSRTSWCRTTSFLEKSRTAFKVPGAAVALVQGGKVIFKKGFGVKRQGGKEQVTTQTLFMIGSITKPLISPVVVDLRCAQFTVLSICR